LRANLYTKFRTRPHYKKKKELTSKHLVQVLTTTIAVSAGGRDISQRQISENVRPRMARIVQNIL